MISPTPPFANNLIPYLFLVADRRIAAGPTPSITFATAAAVPSMVVRAWTVT